MKICKYASMQICKYAHMHIYASIQVCKYTNVGYYFIIIIIILKNGRSISSLARFLYNICISKRQVLHKLYDADIAHETFMSKVISRFALLFAHESFMSFMSVRMVLSCARARESCPGKTTLGQSATWRGMFYVQRKGLPIPRATSAIARIVMNFSRLPLLNGSLLLFEYSVCLPGVCL